MEKLLTEGGFSFRGVEIQKYHLNLVLRLLKKKFDQGRMWIEMRYSTTATYDYYSTTATYSPAAKKKKKV